MDLPLPPSGLNKTLQIEAASSSYTSVDLCHHLHGATFKKENILHSYARENPKIPKGTHAAITGLTNSLSVSREIISI
jgi:hypothetical protein